jgi:hypothetical protein
VKLLHQLQKLLELFTRDSSQDVAPKVKGKLFRTLVLRHDSHQLRTIKSTESNFHLAQCPLRSVSSTSGFFNGLHSHLTNDANDSTGGHFCFLVRSLNSVLVDAVGCTRDQWMSQASNRFEWRKYINTLSQSSPT